ncbi:MAG TPA: hypothetical protein DDY91_04855, partial [Planctomycetaceae bacterium]|nr:hypothetical protein [Planctomycetaceae bacterium]
MSDLKSPALLYFKGLLMLVCGVLAAGLLVAQLPDWTSVALLAIAIWGFCRAYYFAFYVIQHYIDPQYRFAGIGSFVQYLWRR